jgi:hypothetical protein
METMKKSIQFCVLAFALIVGALLTTPVGAQVANAIRATLVIGTSTAAGGAGTASSGTLRTVTASDSPDTAGIGGVSDTAATAGGTGSMNAKLRLITTLLNDLVTTTNAGAAHDVAHGTTDSGFPLKTGCVGQAAISAETAVTDGQRSNDNCDMDGVRVVRLNGTIADQGNSGPKDVAAGTEVIGLTAGGANVKWVITSVMCGNPTTSVDVDIELRDGTGGTVIDRIASPRPGVIYNHPIVGFSANTAVYIDPTAASTGLWCSIKGFKTRL